MKTKVNVRFIIILIGFIMTYLLTYEIWSEVFNIRIALEEIKKRTAR